MNLDDAVACVDTGLVLGFGYPKSRSRPSTASNPKPSEPSLTLGLSAADRVPSSPQSFSSAPRSGVKRENDTGSDGEEDGGTRKKLRLTKEQSALLEDRFREHSTLNPKQKQALAKQLNLRPRQVEVWFQNRRARTKLKQTEVDCEVLKRCCETLSDENRRLHKELQELKKLKMNSPMYMQLSATTPTVCPACKRVQGADGGAPKPKILNRFTRSAAC